MKQEAITLHPNAFPYRAWSVMVTNDPEVFTEVVRRAVTEAPKYHVNRIEFHDFVYGAPSPEGFVENVVRYEKFARVKGFKSLNFKSFSVWLKEDKPPVDLETMDRNVAHFREAAKLVKDAGLKLNIWFHSFREFPQELEECYPEVINPDSDFLFEAMEMILDEFFEKIPEVDAITLTSLAETRSLAEMEGSSSPTERMRRFYSSAYAACKRHGRELILRDFGGGDDFWKVAAALPEDIVFMTKWMPTDWERVHHPMSRRLNLTNGTRFVVEWDLRGEYLGQGFYPYVNPKHFWTALTNVKLFEPEGCVARIHWTDWRGKQHEWSTVFDSANGLNAHVFSQGMASTDRLAAREMPPCTHADLLPYSWIESWIKENYGDRAWPALYEIFKETPVLVEQINICADRFHSNHSFPFVAPFPLHLENVRQMLKEAGREYIDISKRHVVLRARELKQKVAEIDIRPEEKKQELLRSFDTMATFAEIMRIWLLAHADLIALENELTGQTERALELVRLATVETRTVAASLGGGYEQMILERLDRDEIQLISWIKSNKKLELEH